ncbi:MAG: hypothetical protein KDK35_01090 [Leptospiraceae bacterium]|nr:hypothetical protein [Leptospiraceae bacterium]
MSAEATSELTSLGLPLQRTGDTEWAIDLSRLRLFKGLSVVARMIGDEILEQCRAGQTDIVLRQKIIPEITPELAALGLTHVMIFALSGVLKGLPHFQEEFHNQIRTVFGTLQRPRWGSVLFPELSEANPRPEPRALLFPFHLHTESSEIEYMFLVERGPEGDFLRITIDSAERCRLALDRIEHRVVDDLDRRTYLQGLTRIAESTYMGILRECENNRNEHTDNARRHAHFFRQLKMVGLEETETITVRWPYEQTEFLIRNEPGIVVAFLKRIFIVLEDRSVVRRLHEGDMIEVREGDHAAYLDLSRRGRSLNVSLSERRESADIDYYLDRMPRLKAISLEKESSLRSTRVLLIHHITGEILGTIKALENLGVEFLRVLFVKYAGVVPSDYLEALLALPEEKFAAHGLQRVEDRSHNIQGYYLLSRQYSQAHDLEVLESLLEERRLAFYEAMSLYAGHLFLREARRAREEKQRLLLIEDGGYLAPQLNALCLRNAKLAEALQEFGLPLEGTPEEKLSLRQWLTEIFPGSVEHTRNGYNRLADIQEKYGKLAFPAASIAVSKAKRERESGEVSISILHAIESIFHGLGFVLSERRFLVLGSKGAIGRNLMEDISARVGPKNVLGVDVASGEHADDTDWLEARSLDDLPEAELLDIDLVVGVVGHSILGPSTLGRMILHGRRPFLALASGSTKTAEFTEVAGWIEELRRNPKPMIENVPVQLGIRPIRDPQTHHVVGHRARFFFERGSEPVSRDVLLLAGLTPINFLYYGVPTETMDTILAQLVQVSAGLAERQAVAPGLPAQLLAVDEEIDADATLIE